MTYTPGRSVAAILATALLAALPTAAQSGRGDWAMPGNDPGQSGWQRFEPKLSPQSVPASFKFLWKIQLGKPADAGDTLTEPLLATRLINAQGFKDIVYWASSDTLYAVDSELGNLLWTKKFPGRGHTGCAASALSIAIEPPVVINFNARRAPGTPAPAPAPTGPVAATERRLGVPAGGGGFGLKGIYVLTDDGMLHEQVLTTGADFGPPVKFIPGEAAHRVSGLAMEGKTVYTASGLGCRPVAHALWSLDVAAATYPVSGYSLGRIVSLGLSGPAVAPDGTAFVATGPGQPTSAHPNSVVALDRDMKPRDWYSPAKPTVSVKAVSPLTFPYKGKQYVVAPGGDGSVVLLDASSLGGSDHSKPLAATPSFSAPGTQHLWDGFATYLDRSGTAWVYASISAPIASHAKGASISGPTPHGGIVALRIDDADGKPILTPVWVSRDLINPAPPVLAGGVLVALAGGNRSAHAVLSVLDATTGKELFSSGDTIPTYTHRSGLSLGDSHVFFTSHTGMLYSFGIGLEH